MSHLLLASLLAVATSPLEARMEFAREDGRADEVVVFRYPAKRESEPDPVGVEVGRCRLPCSLNLSPGWVVLAYDEGRERRGMNLPPQDSRITLKSGSPRVETALAVTAGVGAVAVAGSLLLLFIEDGAKSAASRATTAPKSAGTSFPAAPVVLFAGGLTVIGSMVTLGVLSAGAAPRVEAVVTPEGAAAAVSFRF